MSLYFPSSGHEFEMWVGVLFLLAFNIVTWNVKTELLRPREDVLQRCIRDRTIAQGVLIFTLEGWSYHAQHDFNLNHHASPDIFFFFFFSNDYFTAVQI